MSRAPDDSFRRGRNDGGSSSSSGGVGDEKSREGRPQEDDTLSSILLMLKSNTNDDDDDQPADDLEKLANVIDDDSDHAGELALSADGTHPAPGSSNTSCSGNSNDETFASAMQSHMSRMSSNGENRSGCSSSTNGSSNLSANPNMNLWSQKSSISRNIKIDDLRSYFHLPIVEVAKQLGICTTLLKRVCRTNKIKKWPYRQIRSIAKSIQSLEMASMNGLLEEVEREKSHEQITFLKRSLEALIDDPSIPIDAAVEMAMRTVAEDGTLPDFVPNADLIGDSDPLLKPTAAQVIAASVASSSVDRVVPCSKPRPPKRKKIDLAGSVNGGCSDGPGLDGCALINSGIEQNDGQSPLPCLIIGESIVSQSIWIDGGRQRVTYLPPVLLTPLMRKKQHNSSKKLVPLIEPDICNCFQMDFLPLPLLRLSDASLLSISSSSSSSSSQAVAVFPVSESSDSAGNSNGTSSGIEGLTRNSFTDAVGDLSSDGGDIGDQGLGQGQGQGQMAARLPSPSSSSSSSSSSSDAPFTGISRSSTGMHEDEDSGDLTYANHSDQGGYSSRHSAHHFDHEDADSLSALRGSKVAGHR